MKAISLIAALLAAVGCSVASYAGELRSVMIEYQNGLTAIIAMERGMQAAFADGDMVLSCQRGVMKFPLADLRNWRFSEAEGESDRWIAAIGTVGADSQSIVVEWLPSGVALSNLPAQSAIRIFDLSGKEVKSYSAEGSFTVTYAHLRPGIYLLVVNGIALKMGIK